MKYLRYLNSKIDILIGKNSLEAKVLFVAHTILISNTWTIKKKPTEIELRFAFSALKAIHDWLMNFSERMTSALIVSNYCDTLSVNFYVNTSN